LKLEQNRQRETEIYGREIEIHKDKIAKRLKDKQTKTLRNKGKDAAEETTYKKEDMETEINYEGDRNTDRHR
jgi:hypothetical protein